MDTRIDMGNQLVTEYSVFPNGCGIDKAHSQHFVIKVVYRGKGLWAVARLGENLGHSGLWEYESQPSSREDDYFAEYRWDLADALAAAHSVINTITLSGKTFAEWETHHTAMKDMK